MDEQKTTFIYFNCVLAIVEFVDFDALSKKVFKTHE